MKAVQINNFGGVEVLEVNSDVSQPHLKTGQVLVENHSASINPIDWKIRSGFLKGAPIKFPFTLGTDFAGVITEVGDGVADFKVGDQVYGNAISLGNGSGSMAEFVAANSTNIAKKPQRLDFVQAAALPLAGASAIQALEDEINLQSGQKILIHGGAGGIGSIAIQIAKAIGAYVVTTVSTDDVKFAKNLGADEVINYKSEDFSEKLKDFDAVFDTAGGEITKKSFKVLKKGGILASMLGQPSPDLARQYDVTVIAVNTVTNTDRLSKLTEFVESGKVKPIIDKEYPLDEAKDAFLYQENVHPQGKVVLNVKK